MSGRTERSGAATALAPGSPEHGRRPRFSGLRTIVVGCGRVGSHAAGLLSAGGAEVVVVDVDPGAFDALGPEFSGFTIAGDASELAVLRRAGCAQARVLLAATESDTLNIMVAQVARECFGVERVVARVFLPEWEGTYRELGIQTISPVVHAVQSLIASVEGSGAG